MEFCSLLDSYGHVVYENKKSFEKKLSEKYFFEWWKNFGRKFWHFFENPPNLENVDFQKKCQKFSTEIFSSLEKIFFGKLFSQNFFIFVNYMSIAIQ